MVGGVPQQGDIIRLSLNPRLGHEQQGGCRHCEGIARSNPEEKALALDCFASLAMTGGLLAMTGGVLLPGWGETDARSWGDAPKGLHSRWPEGGPMPVRGAMRPREAPAGPPKGLHGKWPGALRGAGPPR
ncbi:MAG: hypothetical protein LBT00_11305 [Spirochaetaceae bacterium]|nr:hypothetical protein [Spirochaetaceae bacterium]